MGKHLPATQRRKNIREVRKVYTLARLYIADGERGTGAKYDEGATSGAFFFQLPMGKLSIPIFYPCAAHGVVAYNSDVQ